ncbi:cytochrome P450 4g15-like [Ctenocephalides felis]|uniref:cytochrome P450 4g15-like n=1 Tax=Ctenocephalides felis TaxID=7515 RepID=UPI000E6E4D16|nr:cytochrome P450 4g15-like [Ctenocephalides felis]
MALGKSPHEVLQTALKMSMDIKDSVGRAWFGNKLIVFLWHPDDVEIVLGSHVHIDKSDEYRFFKPWLGNGLLISTGEKWRAHRKLIAPAFHQNVLKSFIRVFNNNSRAVVQRLQKEVGKEFDVHDHLSQTTVDILLETAMGISRKTHDQSGFDYAMAVMKMCEILHLRHYKLWLRFDTIFNWTNFAKKQEQLLGIIHGLTSKVLKLKKEEFIQNSIDGKYSPDYFKKITAETERENARELNTNQPKTGLRDDLDDIDENDVGEKRRLAFLDLMIESAQNGAPITDKEIKEQVDTIMFEGHDTTAAGSSFVMCLLGIHKDIQDKVYQEIYDIFGDSDRDCTFADTLQLKYLERVIFESLRMYPPVPIIARTLKQDVPLKSKNLVVPANCTVVIPTLKMHRNPDIFPNPDVFNPDNFLPENSSSRHYYSYIPFSAGPRSCVGE